MRSSGQIIIVLSILLASFTSQAAIVFAPAYSYYTASVENNGTTTKGKRTSLDLRLAYLHQSGLYLGGMYAITSTQDSDTTSIGPSIGFSARNGFFAIFTYFLTSENKVTGGTKYTDGMGPQMDIGWVFPLTESIFLGPQISYRSVNYTKSESAGVSTSNDTTFENVVPYVTMWFKF